MARNIVICCDGTNNEFGHANTNVVKLYSALLHDTHKQQTYYHPGLGTMGATNALTPIAKQVTKLLGLAVGYGLSQHLADMYSVLMANVEPDDRICIFGFSRGAYTARALSAMLHMFGLIRRDDDVMIAYAIRLLKRKNKDRFEIAARFKRTFSSNVKTAFIGVWDTVNSVGALHDPLTVPYSRTNPDILIGRHAVAIDERRAFYRQNLWQPQPGQDIKQVWFPGVHCDIGGGYAESESGLSKITLQWMIREARAADVLFDTARVDRILGVNNNDYAKPNTGGTLHNSMKLWWPAELIPRTYYDMNKDELRFKIPLGRRRFIADNSLIHDSAFARQDYAPPNLPSNYQIEH